MPGIRFCKPRFGRTAIMWQALAALSATYEAGDVLALTTNATYSLSSRVVARPLLAADKTAKYGAGTILTAPGALTVAAVTATSYGVPFLANGAYNALATWVSATGETVAGTATGTATTSGGTQALLLSPPATPPAGAVGWKAYVSAVGTTTPFFAVSEILGLGQGFAVGGYGASNALVVTGANPPTVNTTGVIAGLAGVAEYSGITNANAQWNAFTSPGGIQPGAATLQLPGMGAALPQDPAVNMGIVPFYAAVYGNEFTGAVNGVVASPILNNIPCGLIMSLSGGITTYTIDTAPAAGAAIGVISECDQTDPLFNGGPGGATNGGRVIFQFNQTYSQLINGINYSGQ